MVVGAYTIINTLGLLVGLPFNTQSTIQSYNFDINDNFYDYVSNNVLSEQDFSSNFRIIIQYNTDSVITEDLILNLSNKVLNFDTFYFTYENKTDNYAFYKFKEGSLDGNSSNYITTSAGLSTPYPVYSINHAYISYKTSSLSPINGDSIIDSITSGLGLMGDITTNFKNGFSALIWNSEENSLTIFGNFALIFLGVSITFAIVKLCLNLIRSKTGA